MNIKDLKTALKVIEALVTDETKIKLREPGGVLIDVTLTTITNSEGEVVLAFNPKIGV